MIFKRNMLVNKIILFLFTILPSILFSQKKIDSNFIKKIETLNNNLKYNESLKILYPILSNKNNSLEDKYKTCILLSNTHKRLFDYTSTERLLQKALNYTSKSSQKNEIKALLSMVYFDINKYSKAKTLMTELKNENYRGLNNENKSIIIMQLGYLSYLNKEYIISEQYYRKSLKIMNTSNSCNQPIVYAKMITLFKTLNKPILAEKFYKTGIEKAKNCNIIKYEIYLTEQYKKCIEKNNYKKRIILNNRLDSLKTKFQLKDKISEVHNFENKLLNQKISEANQKTYLFEIITILLVIIIIGLIYLSVKIYHKRKKIEKEHLNVKNKLNDYLNNMGNNDKENLETLYQNNVLSDRQKNILDLTIKGLTNNEIAEQLFISENTVKYHLKNIYKILQSKNIKFNRRKNKL